jgi:putative tryptophan/tyrosine transport system substrate-binding protein
MPVFRRAAHYVDNIFKGTALRQIPVEQAVTFDLAINLKTAASLGLTFPDSLIARADTVIE